MNHIIWEEKIVSNIITGLPFTKLHKVIELTVTQKIKDQIPNKS